MSEAKRLRQVDPLLLRGLRIDSLYEVNFRASLIHIPRAHRSSDMRQNIQLRTPNNQVEGGPLY